MRTLLAGFALAVAAIVLTSGSNAQDKKTDKKEVVLKGLIACNKCELGKSAHCETVIVVKEDKKDVVYYFDAAAHKKNHGGICEAGKKGTVEGVIGKDGDKKTITVKKITFD